MRPLRFSLNVTLDGCYDHRVMIADEDLHRHAMESIAAADAKCSVLLPAAIAGSGGPGVTTSSPTTSR